MLWVRQVHLAPAAFQTTEQKVSNPMNLGIETKPLGLVLSDALVVRVECGWQADAHHVEPGYSTIHLNVKHFKLG